MESMKTLLKVEWRLLIYFLGIWFSLFAALISNWIWAQVGFTLIMIVYTYAYINEFHSWENQKTFKWRK